jgi:hypothetical protein
VLVAMLYAWLLFVAIKIKIYQIIILPDILASYIRGIKQIEGV